MRPKVFFHSILRNLLNLLFYFLDACLVCCLQGRIVGSILFIVTHISRPASRPSPHYRRMLVTGTPKVLARCYSASRGRLLLAPVSSMATYPRVTPGFSANP